VSALVSVVMPCFNSERHLATAMRSVRAQSWQDLELLVVDGGSRDGSRAVVAAEAALDPRVRLIENANDQGPAHARCTGVRAARGRYVAFLDADDVWLPDKLSTQIAFMEREGVPFSYTLYRRMSDDGSQVSPVVPMLRWYDFRRMLGHRGIGTLTVVIRRDLLTEDIVSVWLRASEDLLWWLLVLQRGVTARLVPEDLARYRDTPGSLSKTRRPTLEAVWTIYRDRFGIPLAARVFYYCSYAFDSVLRRVRLWIAAVAGMGGAEAPALAGSPGRSPGGPGGR
jgi:teichuronic acid biosynthesis glycosyltransferase TuaG